MPAPKGHPLWGNPCKPKRYTPEELWDGACRYFEWCDANPIIIEDFVKGGNFAGDKVYMDHPRAYSLDRLSVFLDIEFQTLINYSKAEGYETYFDTCSRIKKIIDSQHFEGGMAGTFNANIVTRKLGLADKIQNSQSIVISPMSADEAAEIQKAFNDAKKD